MQHVPPIRWPWALALYVALPFLIALLIEPVQWMVTGAGGHRAVGIVLGVNVLLPLSIVAVAVWFPRWKLAALAPFAGIVGFTLGRALLHDVRVWVWTPTFLVNVLHPLALAACLVSGVLALGATFAVRPWRRVGLPDEEHRCRTCGYLCIGLAENRCPECGTGFEESGSP